VRRAISPSYLIVIARLSTFEKSVTSVAGWANRKHGRSMMKNIIKDRILIMNGGKESDRVNIRVRVVKCNKAPSKSPPVGYRVPTNKKWILAG